jgi:O-6-methylguanine DNA methyltransferase
MTSPVGLLFIVASPRGLRHLAFMDRKSIKRMIALLSGAETGVEWVASLLDLKPVVDSLEGYFTGALDRVDVPLDVTGSELQVAVWNELNRIPYGETRTYGEVARAIGQPRAARAIGTACNQNPVPIVVPCHRVIGANGALTGYVGGVSRKKWLLKLEERFRGKVESDNADLFTITSGRAGSKRDTR